jgi:hypothetical protein
MISFVVHLNPLSPEPESPLKFLVSQGYKVSRKKGQLGKPKVKYLGLVLEKQTSPERLHSIANYPLPKTLQKSRAFLGVTGVCQVWIPSYAEFAHPLYCLQQKAQQHSQSLLEWDNKSQDAFLKLSLLALPQP